MSYPKPLSEKSLEKLYKNSGLKSESRDFLHSFFAACANLYGTIALRDVWHIYGQLKNVPKLSRKDLLGFASIARREKQPYYIFEINELYTAELSNELDRHIVSNELVSVGYGKLRLFYLLMEEMDNRPYCVPEDLLSYAEPVQTEYEKALLDFLSGLTSTADECVPKFGRSIANEHKGMKLGEFSFLSSEERFELEWQKRPSAKAAFLEECSGTEAEKLLRLFKRSENIGRRSPIEAVQWFIDELQEAGVVFQEKQVKTLTQLIVDYHNNSRLWCISGWKPEELAKKFGRSLPSGISFGPGIQKAFAEGALDKTELVRKFREMGIKVIE